MFLIIVLSDHHVLWLHILDWFHTLITQSNHMLTRKIISPDFSSNYHKICSICKISPISQTPINLTSEREKKLPKEVKWGLISLFWLWKRFEILLFISHCPSSNFWTITISILFYLAEICLEMRILLRHTTIPAKS